MKNCPICNAVVNDDAIFCNSCGASIDVSAHPYQNNTSNHPTSFIEKLKSKPLLWIVPIAIIAAIILYFVIFSSPHSSPEAVLDAYVDAINDKDAEDLYEIAADPIHQKKAGVTPDGVEKYRDFLKQPQSVYGNNFTMSVKVDNVEKEGDSATITGTATIKYNGKTDTFPLNFRTTKIDGKWYWED